MTPLTDDLRSLARTLADWCHGTTFGLFLFGSRVRGDHRSDSGVDILFSWPNHPTVSDCEWWTKQNKDGFAAINALLPGPLKVLECNDPVANRVIEAAAKPVHRDRNVICVYLPPKIIAARSPG